MSAISMREASRVQRPTGAAPEASNIWSLTKVTPPRLSAVAANERLFARLDDALSRPIVWVQGPPGAGKTTLVADWLAARRRDPVWLRLDSEDSDPSNLFFYLGMADARARNPGSTPRLPLLTPEFHLGAATFSRNFFQKLFAGLDPPVVVLDDYHEIDLVSPAHDCLAAGMMDIPDGGHLIVISRFPPPRELARLRVNGKIELITPEALRLTAAEAEALFRARGAPTPAHDLAAAMDLTQGWTAGLVLLMEAARSGVPLRPDGGVEPELLFDYFAGEVFRTLDEHERGILTRLSAMPSMTETAAKSLAENADAGALLETLARRGYFTTRDAEAEPHYRFHPLFQQFLRAEARQAFDADELCRLRLRAAQILAECRQPEAAAPLLREAEAWDDLARLILSWAEQMEATGRHSLLGAWIDGLPPERIEADPWLIYWSGVARQPFAPADGRPWFSRALSLFVARDDSAGAFLAWSRLGRSILHDEIADQAQLDELIRVLRDLMRRHQQFPSAEVEADVSTTMFAALARRTVDRGEFAHWRQAAQEAALRSGRISLVAYVRFADVCVSLIDGDLARVREQIALLPNPESLGDAPYERALVYFAQAISQLYALTPGDCVATAERALVENDRAGVYIYSHSFCSFALAVCAFRGRLDEARDWQRRCGEYMDRFYPRRASAYWLGGARLELVSGDHAAAVSAARRAVEISVADNYPFNQGLNRLVLAQALIAAGESREAALQLDALARLDEKAAIGIIRFPRELLRAEALSLLGREDEGLDVLREALAVAESKGEAIVYIHRPVAARIFVRALENSFSPALVRRLIIALDLAPPDGCGPSWPWPLRIETLGGFRLLKDGEPLTLSRKTPRRLFNLLKALAAFGGRDVPQEKILDAVWPDEEGDSARQSFDVAVHRLRKLLGDKAAISVGNGRIGLDPARCSLDLWDFEAALDGRDKRPEASVKTSELYAGDFLPNDEDLPWTAPMREKLRALFVRGVETYADALRAQGDWARAEGTYRAAIKLCPDAEKLYIGLMESCAALNRKDEALLAYQQLERRLAMIGQKPSAAMAGLCRAMKA